MNDFSVQPIIREFNPQDQAKVGEIFDLYWTGEFREKAAKRVYQYLDNDPEVVKQGFKWFVAEENGEVVGVAASRKLPEHTQQYAQTSNPCELYLIAAKYKGKGIGTLLRDHFISEAKKLGYTEALFFSGETHQDSWAFHDNSDFKRAGSATAPDGEPGFIWQMELK